MSFAPDSLSLSQGRQHQALRHVLPGKGIPLRGELVHSLRAKFATQDKISFFELPGADSPVVVAAQPLLVASGSHHRPATGLLKEVDIVNPFGAMSFFVVSADRRRPIF